MGEGMNRPVPRSCPQEQKHGAPPRGPASHRPRDVTAAENEESMARTKNNQRSASRVAVDVGATGTNPVSKLTVAILAVCIVAAIWAAAMMTVPGRVAYVYLYTYAEFYMGVLTLVSLSITI